MDLKKKPRQWQKESIDNVVDRCNGGNSKNVVCVNACVGSGKTDLAAYAIGQFIKSNLSGKTLQMFVTPRIRLCDQQADGIVEYIEQNFGLKNGVDFKMLRRDSSQNGSNAELDLRSKTFTTKHAVVVVCDESLWGSGKDDADPDKRWHRWVHWLKKRSDEGWLLGNCVLDEAHNYTAKVDKLFGGDVV